MTTKLANIRRETDLTQKKLAEISGVNLRMIQKYESGDRDINRAEAETVYRLAKALNVPMESLIKDLEDN